MRDNNVPEQEDVVVVGDLVVPARVGAEVAVDVGTVVLPHADGKVDGAGIDSNSMTISLSSHGRRHVKMRLMRVLAGVVRRSVRRRSWRWQWWLR